MNCSRKNSLTDAILDIIFPPHCLICGKRIRSGVICAECESRMEFLNYPLIEHTGKKHFYAVFRYGETVSEIVKLLKFGKRKVLASYVAKTICNFMQKENIEVKTVGYVPMSLRERKKRGFNQSRLIALHLSEMLGAKLFDGIKKVKETEKQVGLSRTGRIANVKGAFSVKGSPEGPMVIVDDVFTTGSTAHEVVKAVYGKNKIDIFFIAFSRRID